MPTDPSPDEPDPVAAALTLVRKGGGVATPVLLAALLGYWAGFSESVTALLVIVAGVIVVAESIMSGWGRGGGRPSNRPVRGKRQSGG